MTTYFDFHISGLISEELCTLNVENAALSVDGVEMARLDFRNEKLIVKLIFLNNDIISMVALSLESIGYQVEWGCGFRIFCFKILGLTSMESVGNVAKIILNNNQVLDFYISLDRKKVTYFAENQINIAGLLENLKCAGFENFPVSITRNIYLRIPGMHHFRRHGNTIRNILMKCEGTDCVMVDLRNGIVNVRGETTLKTLIDALSVVDYYATVHVRQFSPVRCVEISAYKTKLLGYFQGKLSQSSADVTVLASSYFSPPRAISSQSKSSEHVPLSRKSSGRKMNELKLPSQTQTLSSQLGTFFKHSLTDSDTHQCLASPYVEEDLINTNSALLHSVPYFIGHTADTRSVFYVHGLVSASRGTGLSHSLMKLRGVFRVHVGLLESRVEVLHDTDIVGWTRLQVELEGLGIRVTEVHSDSAGFRGCVHWLFKITPERGTLEKALTSCCLSGQSLLDSEPGVFASKWLASSELEKDQLPTTTIPIPTVAVPPNSHLLSPVPITPTGGILPALSSSCRNGVIYLEASCEEGVAGPRSILQTLRCRLPHCDVMLANPKEDLFVNHTRLYESQLREELHERQRDLIVVSSWTFLMIVLLASGEGRNSAWKRLSWDIRLRNLAVFVVFLCCELSVWSLHKTIFSRICNGLAVRATAAAALSIFGSFCCGALGVGEILVNSDRKGVIYMIAGGLYLISGLLGVWMAIQTELTLSNQELKRRQQDGYAILLETESSNVNASTAFTPFFHSASMNTLQTLPMTGSNPITTTASTFTTTTTGGFVITTGSSQQQQQFHPMGTLATNGSIRNLLEENIEIEEADDDKPIVTPTAMLNGQQQQAQQQAMDDNHHYHHRGTSLLHNDRNREGRGGKDAGIGGVGVRGRGGYVPTSTSSTTANIDTNTTNMIIDHGTNIEQAGFDETVISADLLQAGDIVKVLQGMRCPADGEVVRGAAEVSDPYLSGGSMSIIKKVGDDVTGGSYVVDGQIHLRVSSDCGPRALKYQINELIKSAQVYHLHQKLYQLHEDKTSHHYNEVLTKWGARILRAILPVIAIVVGCILVLCFLSAAILQICYIDRRDILIIRYLWRIIAIMSAGSPAALGVAVYSSTLVGAWSVAPQLGFETRRAVALQKLYQITTCVFDKTGTLTEGRMEVYEFKGFLSDIECRDRLESDTNSSIAKSDRGTVSQRKKSTDFHDSQYLTNIDYSKEYLTPLNGETDNVDAAEIDRSTGTSVTTGSAAATNFSFPDTFPRLRAGSDIANTILSHPSDEDNATDTVTSVNSLDTILWLAGSAELRSTHYIGKAIVRFCLSQSNLAPLVEPDSYVVSSGMCGGVCCCVDGRVVIVGSLEFLREHLTDTKKLKSSDFTNLNIEIQDVGNLAVFVSIDGYLRAVFSLHDAVRREALPLMMWLKAKGIQRWMITGDSSRAAASVGRQLGIDPSKIISSALPSSKQQHISKLQKDGERVLYIGDGDNDSPALAQADVSMVLGTAQDMATECADLVMTSTDLRVLQYAMLLSRNIRFCRYFTVTWIVLVAVTSFSAVFYFQNHVWVVVASILLSYLGVGVGAVTVVMLSKLGDNESVFSYPHELLAKYAYFPTTRVIPKKNPKLKQQQQSVVQSYWAVKPQPVSTPPPSSFATKSLSNVKSKLDYRGAGTGTRTVAVSENVDWREQRSLKTDKKVKESFNIDLLGTERQPLLLRLPSQNDSNTSSTGNTPPIAITKINIQPVNIDTLPEPVTGENENIITTHSPPSLSDKRVSYGSLEVEKESNSNNNNSHGMSESITMSLVSPYLVQVMQYHDGVGDMDI